MSFCVRRSLLGDASKCAYRNPHELHLRCCRTGSSEHADPGRDVCVVCANHRNLTATCCTPLCPQNSALAETSPDGAARRGSAGSSVGLGSDAGLGLAPGALASGGRPVSGASASDLLSSREVDPGGKGGKSKGLAKKLKNLFKK